MTESKPIKDMTRREYYSHAAPGWDNRFTQPDFNWKTGQVESDQPKFPTENNNETIIRQEPA